MTTNELKAVLEEENAKLRVLLLSIECGEIQPETLPMPLKFYTNKKDRLDALIWVLDIECRLKGENAKT